MLIHNIACLSWEKFTPGIKRHGAEVLPLMNNIGLSLMLEKNKLYTRNCATTSHTFVIKAEILYFVMVHLLDLWTVTFSTMNTLSFLSS